MYLAGTGCPPVFSDKFDITKHPQYKYLADAEQKNTFDVAKYLKRRLKVRPDDRDEVFDPGKPPDTGSPTV